jgi:hypothetical protein
VARPPALSRHPLKLRLRVGSEMHFHRLGYFLLRYVNWAWVAMLGLS